MNSMMPLYSALAPNNNYDSVFERPLTPTVTITLRPLSLPGDWPHIGKWLQRELGRRGTSITHVPEKYLRETLAIMLQCDFAQPFVGLINEQPAFLVELCEGDKHCDAGDGGAFLFEPGDHAMRLVLSHPVIHTRYWSEYALFSCLDYFFSYPEVNRIVWQLPEKDKFHSHLAKQLGFTPCLPVDCTNGDHPQVRNATRRGGLSAYGVTKSAYGGLHVFLYLRENFKQFLAHYRPHMQKLR